MTQRERIFRIWAPSGSLWSIWAKPVLFANLPESQQLAHLDLPQVDLTWLPPADSRTAVIIDLPAAESVSVAITVGAHGYRPVPLFNAVPGPLLRTQTGELFAAEHVSVNLGPAILGLMNYAQTLEALNLPLDAPPVFLLDSLRRTGRRAHVAQGDFDNRSISFPTDFPSAVFLAQHGINQVLLVKPGTTEPASDLAHTLRRWQDGGIRLFSYAYPGVEPAQPLTVTKPAFFRLLWYQLLATLKLRRNPLGGFGGILPTESAG